MRKPHWEWMKDEFDLTIKSLVEYRESKYKEKKPLGLLAKLIAMQNYLKKTAPKMVPNKDSTFAITQYVFSFYALFTLDGEKIYKMAREFSEELKKVSLDIQSKYLPVTHQLICIELPDHMRFFAGEQKYVHSIYVGLSDEPDMINRSEDKDVKKVMFCILPLYTEAGELDPEIQTTTLTFYSDEETFNESLKRTMTLETNTIKYWNKELMQFILNSVLYINSGDPDLREYRAPRPPQTQKIKKLRLWHKQHENQSLVDMIHVGFDFKKPKIYQVGATTVIGHFRWQPWGPRTEPRVKLIWIDQHERKFNKGEMKDETPTE
jgi:hypothetical protein